MKFLKILINTNIIFFLYSFIFLLYVSSFTYSQNIKDYFQNEIAFTEYPIIGSSYPGGGFINYTLQDWKMRTLIRNPLLGDMIPQSAIEHIASSNQLTYILTNEAEQDFKVIGFEVLLKKSLPLSQLGYTLINQDNITSNYFIVVFFGKNILNFEIRLIAHLSKNYTLTAEIITGNNIYYMYSEYKQYSPTTLSLIDDKSPSLLSINRIDQSTMALTSTKSKKILWIADELSGEERKVVHFSTSVFSSIRFLPKYHNLYQKRVAYLKELNKEKEKDTIIIYEDFILLPSDLQPEIIEDLSIE